MSNGSESSAGLRQELSKAFQDLRRLIEASRVDLHAQVAALGAQVETLEKQVQELSAILRDANGGERALVTKFAVLAQEVNHLKAEMKSRHDVKLGTARERVRGTWQVLVALITAIAALLLGLIQVLAGR